MKFLVSTKAPVEAKPEGDTGVVVRTMIVHKKEQPAAVATQGLVVPAHEVSLQPEVQGRVVFRSKNLVPGGRFKEGEVLLRIDASEYALRAKQSATQIEQAQQQLMLEQSRGDIAKEEWRLIGEDGSASESGRSVALREPQRRDAESRIELAEHERGLAVLNVGRTTLRAPFNGFVRQGLVNVGQFISPAASLGTLVGSDEFWVQVSVPIDRLSSLQVPGFNAPAGEGSEVSVWQDLGDNRVVRKGRILRLFGDVDPVGRMARVLAQVSDPLGVESEEGEPGLPLLLGAYVRVDIQGRDMMAVIEVPRAAVHSGRYVYVMGEGNRLQVRDVEIAWRKQDTFLVTSGLEEGDEVITSRISSAVEGLKVRRVEGDAAGASITQPKEDETPATAKSEP
jgi:RND family efflux transporter MFP subunit